MANSSNLVFMVSSSILIALILMFLSIGTFPAALGRPLMKTEAEKAHHHKEMMTITFGSSRAEKMGSTVVVPENTNNNNGKWRRHTLDGGSASSPDTTTKSPQQSDGIGNWTDDFRPTDPGPSPGAGHSAPHTNLVPNP